MIAVADLIEVYGGDVDVDVNVNVNVEVDVNVDIDIEGHWYQTHKHN